MRYSPKHKQPIDKDHLEERLYRKSDWNSSSSHIPPALFPYPVGISNSFKRARTSSPSTSTEETSSETEAEAVNVATPSSESDYLIPERGESSSHSLPFPSQSGGGSSSSSSSNIVHAHQQTPLRFSFGMNSSENNHKATVDGLLTEKMLNLGDRDADTSRNLNLPSYSQAMVDSDNEQLTSIRPADRRPDIRHQLELIKESNKESLQEGQSWFLIDRRWYRLWSAACSDEPKSKDGADLKVGMVETRDLLQVGETNLLKPGLEEGIGFELLSSEAWRLLTTWYGLRDPIIERKVIRMPSTDILRIELNPPKLIVYGLGEIKTSFKISMSVLQTLDDLKEAAFAHLVAGQDTSAESEGLEIRFWRLPPCEGNEDVNDESLQAAGVELVPEHSQGGATLAELQIDQPVERLVLETRKKGSSWAFTEEGKPVAPSLKGIFSRDGSDFLSRVQQGKTNASDVGSSSGAASSSNMVRITRSQTAAERGSEKQRGLTGLYNLGNTCFMNAALQCMSNTPELKDYFVSGVYKTEVNVSNPLGMGGAMAKVFGELLTKLWTSGGGAWHPREFKTVLSRFSPQFIGYAQQDTQELLAFLLDGLHEDLNRIVKKPYIEAPDWEGGGTREMVAFAHKQWEIYKLRNDSVIVDLFQGQYRSTLVCPDCGKVSIKFDPFMYLTLPIPNRKTFVRRIVYIPWNRQQSPIEVDMRFTGETSIQKLKKNLGEWFQSDSTHMIVCDVFSKTFYRTYGDFELASEIGANDVTFVYELPSQLKPIAPLPFTSHSYHRREHIQDLENNSKKKYDNQLGEQMALLPVFSVSKGARQFSNYYNRGSGKAFGQPFFVAIAKKDVNDEKVIHQAIMDKYMQYTGDATLLERYLNDDVEEESQSSPEDWNMINNVETPSSVILPENNLSIEETVAEIHDGGETVHIVPDLPQETLKAKAKKKTDAEKGIQTKGPAIFFIVNREDQSPLTLKPEGFEEYGEELGKRAARLSITLEDASNRMDTDQDDDLVHVGKDGQNKSNWPLVYTGGSLVCVWPDTVKDKVFGDSEDAWAGGSTRAKFIDPELEAERKMAEGGGKKAKVTISIDDCLNEFTKEEQLGESDPWYCPQCKDFKQATKKFDLWKVPDILVVHLKRFSSGRISRDKIDSFIDFPIQGLDLTDRVEGAKAVTSLYSNQEDDEKLMESIGSLGANDDAVESDAPLYDLYAVDNHYGGLGGGHYTAYAKNPEDEKWYYFDDSSVRLVNNTDEVKGQAAYLLFYRRRTARPIGGKSREKVRETVKITKEEANQDTHHFDEGAMNFSTEAAGGGSSQQDGETAYNGHEFNGQARLAGPISLDWDQSDKDELDSTFHGPEQLNGWDMVMQSRRETAALRNSNGSHTASLGDEEGEMADDSSLEGSLGSLNNLSDDVEQFSSSYYTAPTAV